MCEAFLCHNVSELLCLFLIIFLLFGTVLPDAGGFIFL